MGKQKSEIGIDFDDKYLTKCGILPKKEQGHCSLFVTKGYTFK